MSAHYWRNSGKAQKNQFISLKNSYHGETLGALSVTDVALFKDAYGPLIIQNAIVPSPDGREAEAGESSQSFALRCAEELELHLQQHHQSIAAFIVEPLVQGAAGMGMYHRDYLRKAREICDQYDVHLIADEIAVGMGRTGTMFACEQAGIVPDYLLLSKGITGGYLPLSVVMTTDVIYQAFYSDEVTRGFLHSHSYTGNPLACRAALATLDIFNEDDVINANFTKSLLFNKLLEPIRQHSKVRNFRNTGMIWAWEVDTPDPDFALRCFSLGLQLGVLLRPMDKTIYIMPPYILGEDELSILIKQTMIILEQLT
jgi:adenosylmethionine-8-amino-7-oxononanoate aminotransferase